MSILVANIGTSDIAVKAGDYFLPIAFNRREPNLEKPAPETLEAGVWETRDEKLSIFFRDLQVDEGNTFRQKTQALLDTVTHEKTLTLWLPKISIGRIQGVIQSALRGLQEKDTLEVYLVSTNQTEIGSDGHENDTVYAGHLIEQYLRYKEPALFVGDYPKVRLMQETISFDARDEDRLYDFYSKLFERIDPERIVYVSVKGGTPQMQQALRAHALAPHTKAQVFVSPKLSVQNILSGKPSDCQRVSYWRYQKNQKHKVVQLLLNRWDFDGADILLSDWLVTLEALDVDDTDLLRTYKANVKKVIQGLRMAVAHLNLDFEETERLQANSQQLQSFLKQFGKPETPKNLYIQCKIYAKLNQISHFLSRLGTFYEATQNCLVEALGGMRYIDLNESWKWNVLADALREAEPALWLLFKGNYGNPHRKEWSVSKRNEKRKYIKGLIKYRYGNSAGDSAPSLSLWRKLDFWYRIRNKVMHGAKGVSENRLAEVYEQIGKREGGCQYQQILPTMQDILNTIALADGETNDLDNDHEYGLYGCIREWAIATLKSPAD